MRIGSGYDSHKLVEGRRLIIGGVDIPFEKGLQGHSDADVLCHAIIDAVMGGLGLGDIGKHFPDSDNKWEDASSIDLLSRTMEMVKDNGFEVTWIDSTVMAERPKLLPFIEEMKENISKAGIPSSLINIKATTNEGMGFIGRSEGIAAQAVCLLRPV
ncbi:MAG TPA: 2-C-methyl-D-erythritol 2,4-cyclodiphosphate synthase [Nitrospirae bacterium]|nr:2-C-methyl-D-erythritol 2,4-cyclodiphosphate synthase [bacterium BMS3Bbin09]HDH34578.1 2-C-methyl-D-erythritol 2,4-cyclodiphosphate synthase [Nitrospirota bacterium]HDN94588.1 2-C-methyl-D-erythritol 2,4-cyclodiphosphate synthase [Nitrospirota bacterium]HDO67598.1 2-C-methyl-D-erythritol 2,4-cyclodiphosphate synthase [Nitrospirota bacterium]HEW81772.1 2-C-methyl-D-erythritol 2,4-cyclodiphosphate synthase [Nitrospirota bacterium]